jgi:hypothetical protein
LSKISNNDSAVIIGDFRQGYPEFITAASLVNPATSFSLWLNQVPTPERGGFID